MIEQDRQQWLACPRHGRPVMGCGRFNPLRPLDRDGVLDASWKAVARHRPDDVRSPARPWRRPGRLLLERGLQRELDDVGSRSLLKRAA